MKTILTSMHGGFNLDGVKRDCLPWAMDAVLSSIGMNCVFGDDGTPRMFRNRIEQQTALYMSRSRAIPCAPICWAWSGPRHASL